MKKYGYWIFLFALLILAACILSDILFRRELVPHSEYLALLFCAAVYVNSPQLRRRMFETLLYFLDTLLAGFGVFYVLLLLKIDLASSEILRNIAMVTMVLILLGCIVFEQIFKRRPKKEALSPSAEQEEQPEESAIEIITTRRDKGGSK